MATRKNTIETLSEEQKQRQEEIRKEQREQLAADAAQSGTQIVNDPLAKPEMLNEAVVYGSIPKKPEEAPAPAPAAMTGKDLLERDIAASKNAIDIKTSARLANPERLNEAVVVAEMNPKATSNETPSSGQEEAATSPASDPVNIGKELLERDKAASMRPERPLGSPASLEPKENEATVTAQAYRDQNRSAADILQAYRDEALRQEQESRDQVNQDINAAKWTGLTELAASLANMIGVGEGNAISQTYKPVAQDWMKKADQDMREHRNRVADLRQRQMEMRSKLDQLKAQNNISMAKVRTEYEKTRLENEYRKAQIAYQQAKTETERREAEAKIRAYEALINQREASAYSSVTRADAYADTSRQNANSRSSSVANQNANRNITSSASANANNARADKIRQDMGGGSKSKKNNTPGVTTDKNGLPQRTNK